MHNTKILLTIFLFAGIVVVSCNDDSSSTTGPGSPSDSTEVTARPEITGFTASSAPIGSKLTINGRHFSSVKSENTVKIGGTQATIDSASTRQLKVTVPKSLDFTDYIVYVRVKDHQTASPGPLSVVTNAPSIEAIDPTSGGIDTKVHITGINFSANSSEITVMFGDQKATVQSANKNEIVTTVPEGLTIGDVAVSVNVSGATEQATSPNPFNYALELVPASKSEGHPWRYTEYVPNYQDLKWITADYDDSGWETGDAGFGSYENYRVEYARTQWEGYDIYLRKTFTIDDLSAVNTDTTSSTSGNKLMIKMWHDDWAKVYINGVKAVDETGFITSYEYFSLSPESIKALKEGENIIAVHDHQNSGGQYIDLGLYDVAQ